MILICMKENEIIEVVDNDTGENLNFIVNNNNDYLEN